MKGNLELILPGCYYSTMKGLQYKVLNDNVENEIFFPSLKRVFLQDFENTQVDTSKIPKIGYAF